ncbi:hypothetical protein Cantr_09572 [Candida viswanathii]|uniref:WD repeat-containing protein C3H5.08c n=1 Tax=Candida viswanathii TaxID=5486 RepID=A0A367YER5_9ASCO|nr:hypothetical protein Cantr_09572 [Candida viswanathii]
MASTTQTEVSSASKEYNGSSQKKGGFLNKLIKRSNSTKNLPLHPTQSSRSFASSTNAPSRRSSMRRDKRNSVESNQFVDDDEASLYDDDYDETNSVMEDDTDDSLFEPATQAVSSASTLRKVKSYNYTTFDNHNVEEKVAFPTTLDGLDLDLDIPEDNEPPYAGLTYESFLTPKYVKTTRRNKQSPRIINNLFLAQELNVVEDAGSDTDDDGSDDRSFSHNDEDLLHDEESGGDIRREIFVMEFSKDGKYLAAAGRDAVVRVWKVISSPLGRVEFNQLEKASGPPARSNKRDYVFDPAPVFQRQPIREFRGHSSNILSLAWSKNNFLITGSMDRTARLWHVDRALCLQVFQHEDFVTAVKFHPHDDRFFLSGSLDNEVRLWSILENTVSYNKHLGDDVLITALEFAPDGAHCFVGGFNGSLFILETKGLYHVFQVEIKERSIGHPFHSHNKNGNKITGIKVFNNPLHDETKGKREIEKYAVLVTTNDSKIRMITVAQKKLITRFRGLTNNSSSIVADSTEDQKYIISGSEDHYCYVWENNNSIINNKLKQSIKEFVIDGRQHISDFHHKHEKYSKFISLNKLFNKFLEDDHDTRHDFIANENNSYTYFHAHHSKCNVALFAPESTKKLLTLSDDLIYDLRKRGDACRIDPGSRFTCNGKSVKIDNSVMNGDIIVTADQYGVIRVFRQDSAYLYRKKFIEFYKKGQCKSNSDLHLLSPSDRGMSLRRGLSRADRSSSLLRDTSISPVRGGEPQMNIRSILASKINPSSSSTPSTPLSESTFSANSNLSDGRPHSTSSAYLTMRAMGSNAHTHRNNGMFVQPNMALPVEHDEVLQSSPSGSEITLGEPTPHTSNPKLSTSQENFKVVNKPDDASKPMIPRIVLPDEKDSQQQTESAHPADLHSQLRDLKNSSHVEPRGRTK